MVKATDTRPGTKGAPTKKTAKNMSEVHNDIQIRQRDVDDFTEEEKTYFENAFSRKQGPPKILRTQNNPITLRENEEFKGEIPILKKTRTHRGAGSPEQHIPHLDGKSWNNCNRDKQQY